MKKVLMVVLAALVLGAKIDAPGAIVLGREDPPSKTTESVGYIWEGEGLSQFLGRVGCNIRWTSDVMELNGITFEMLPKLQIGREILYPANCADVPPACVAENSERIFKSERARLKVARTPRISEPSEEFAELVARNAELEKQVAELTKKLAAAEAAKGQATVPVPENADDDLKLAKARADLLAAEAKKADDGWNAAALALANKTEELGKEKSFSRALGFVVAILSGVILALMFFRRKRGQASEAVPTSEKAGDTAVAAVSASPPPKEYASLGGFTGSPPKKVVDYRGVECEFDKPYVDDTDKEVHCRCVRCKVGDVKERNILRHLRTAEQHLDLNQGLPRIASGEGGSATAAPIGSTAA